MGTAMPLEQLETTLNTRCKVSSVTKYYRVQQLKMDSV